MINSVTVKFKNDKEDKRFVSNQYRCYLTVDYKESFVVITDTSNNTYAYPTQDVDEVITTSEPY